MSTHYRFLHSFVVAAGRATFDLAAFPSQSLRFRALRIWVIDIFPKSHEACK